MSFSYADSLNGTTTTEGSVPRHMKECVYCGRNSTFMCLKGACYSCHKENACHEECT